MVDINFLGLSLGVTLTLLAVSLHYARGTGWTPKPDISQEVLEQRASTVSETEFAEPMNRSVGGGAIPAGSISTGGEKAELEETDTEDSKSPADIPDDEVEYFEIEFSKQGETVDVANNQTLLEAGEESGWEMPYACRQGQCVSCSGKIIDSGNSEEYITHDNQQMLDDDELEDGYTLTCVAYPKADLTIETSEAP
jgi:2Fe-2S type ferredoxin